MTLILLTQASLVLLFPLSLSKVLLCFLVYGGGTVLTLYLLFYPRSQWLVGNRSQVRCTDKACFALTFDDGPSGHHTLRLLEILRDNGVKATFFVIGKRAEAEPELLRQICEEGHTIANHTYSHPPLFCFLTPRQLRAEIEQGQETISRICGVKPEYFRSPVGLRHPLLELYLRRADLEFVSWRVRAFDTIVQNPEVLRNRILKRIGPGDIVMLHDKGGPAGNVMLDVLPGLLNELKDRGFECVPV